jgi:hypothetical protein
LTITLAQAAVFLVRITKAPQTVQAALKVDTAVISHYLQMSIDLLESSDLSETRLGTNLAKTLKEVGRAAGLLGSSSDDVQDDVSAERRVNAQPSVNMAFTPAPAFNINMPTFSTGEPPNLENFFQSDNGLDLSYLLGLSREGDGTLLQEDGNWSSSNFGNVASFTDFGFGGVGTGNSSSNWNGNLDGFGNVFGYQNDSHG